MLGDDSWPPVAEFYDFLKAMDMEEQQSAKKQTPEKEEEVDEEEVDVKEHVVEKVSDSSSSSPEHNPNIHSEL